MSCRHHPQITLFNGSRIPTECFGGQTVSHDFNLHTQTVETLAIPNPKSAYLLVFHRLPGGSLDGPRDSAGKPALRREMSTVEVSNAAPILQDNQQHMLVSRIFNQPHLAFMLELIKATLLQARESVLSSPETEMSININTTPSFIVKNSLVRRFIDQMCQVVYFVVQFLSKTRHEYLYTGVINHDNKSFG